MSCSNPTCACNQTNFQKVRQFHKVFELLLNDTPVIPDKETQILRAELILEEVKEFFAEFGLALIDPRIEVKDVVKFNNNDFNLKNITKELADILYVVYGCAASFGLPIDKAFAEVHRSNMTKLTAEGEVLRREDGKVLKSDQYEPADMDNVLGYI